MAGHNYFYELAGERSYNRERNEQYQELFKAAYYRKLKKVNRHGKPIKSNFKK